MQITPATLDKYACDVLRLGGYAEVTFRVPVPQFGQTAMASVWCKDEPDAIAGAERAVRDSVRTLLEHDGVGEIILPTRPSGEAGATQVPVARKAYFGQGITVPGPSICFAESHDEARALLVRSASDDGYTVRVQDIHVRRAPAFDDCMPDDYHHQLFSLCYARNYLRTNVKDDRAGASPAPRPSPCWADQ